MFIEPRVVLVTGASAGIGRETALTFARQGCHVGAAARRQDRLEALVQQAGTLPGTIVPYAVDVCDPAGMEQVVDDMLSRWGRLDVLIANAGIGQRGAIADSAWDDLEVVLRTNIDGVLHSVRAAVPAMRRSQSGHIVTVSSVVSISITPYATVYAASKAALNALARGLRVELAPDNIWVSNVLVGQTTSEFAAARRGESGALNARMPTMRTEYVARCIAHTVKRRRRTLTLRWFDRAIVFAGLYAPWLMDRLTARFYRAH
jgi:short-subunit dehydrogenase